MIKGREWRLFAAIQDDRFVVAAQPADVRNSAARQISARIILPSLCAIPIAALMIWFAVAYGLRPLVKISAALRQRSPRDLSSIDTHRLPPDIAPVAHALNELMRRLSEIMAAQRTFIADAAHELLTPLTALRLQAATSGAGAESEPAARAHGRTSRRSFPHSTAGPAAAHPGAPRRRCRMSSSRKSISRRSSGGWWRFIHLWRKRSP